MLKFAFFESTRHSYPERRNKNLKDIELARGSTLEIRVVCSQETNRPEMASQM